MSDFRIAFDQPWYLLLLALIPFVWWLGRGALAGLSPKRRYAAWGLRAAIVALVVLALAEVQWVRSSPRLAVLYVVDRSLSVPADQAAAALAYIRRSASEQMDEGRLDAAGVVVFGRQGAVEALPLAGQEHLPERFESFVDAEATDLAAALRLAQAVFPADAAKRVVILSDGNQNVGDALAQAHALADLGIGIDVVPLAPGGGPEVAVEKIVLPADIRQGAPFEGRVVLHATGDGQTRPGGRLRISRAAGRQTETLVDEALSLAAGKQVFSFREEIASPDFYTYRARFVPDAPDSDTRAENNEATAYVQVRGRGQVLLIEDWVRPGEFAAWVDLLERANLEVTVQPSNQLFAGPAELERYDLVILADVPRASGDAEQGVGQFSDEQIEMLVQATRYFGGGLLMLGGPHSFGAGGWTNTALEKAMPVDFQVKNAKVLPRGALVLVIDSSGSMSGDKLELSKAAALEAVGVLGDDDYVGVVSFDAVAHTILPMSTLRSRAGIDQQIARLASGGGTDMELGMVEGYRALDQVDAAVKHMIVLSDGQTNGANFVELAEAARRRKITTTSVAVGKDSAAQLMNDVARAGGGRFYRVHSPQSIPRIFVKEAMRVARPVVYENASGIVPARAGTHPVLDGIDGPLPPLTGFVLTTPKSSPLVEVPLQSPLPLGHQNALLASWQFGLGRAVAFTSDAGHRWAKAWPEWPDYEKLWTQVVRWTMRPTEVNSSLGVVAEARDGRIQVVVTALDADEQFLNFLGLTGTLIGPDLQPRALSLEQTAPGHYLGTIDVPRSGSYFLSIGGASGQAPVRVGVNVPYSAEFNQRASNLPLLASLAAIVPKGGRPGIVVPGPAGPDQLAAALAANVFRHDLAPATTRQDRWHTLAFAAACLFLLDVLNRRVALGFGWLSSVARRLRAVRGPAASDGPEAALNRLQARKRQLDRQLSERRDAVGFAGDVVADLSAERKDEVAAARPSALPAPAVGVGPQAEDDSYTTRLLKAKQRVWEEA